MNIYKKKEKKHALRNTEVEYGRWRLHTVVGPLLFVSLNSVCRLDHVIGSDLLSESNKLCKRSEPRCGEEVKKN